MEELEKVLFVLLVALLFPLVRVLVLSAAAASGE